MGGTKTIRVGADVHVTQNGRALLPLNALALMFSMRMSIPSYSSFPAALVFSTCGAGNAWPDFTTVSFTFLICVVP